MNHPTNRNASAQPAPRRTALALGVALAAGLFAGSASAQVLVADTANETTNNAMALFQKGAQFENAVAQLKQMLVTVQGLGVNISLTQNKLQQISDPSSLIDQNCPGSSGNSVIGSMVTSLASTVSLTQPITSSQQQICANIVTVEIDEYNKTVALLDQMDQYGGTLQKLNQLANELDTLGKSSGATSQATTYSATVAKSMSDWQSSIQGDEALIKSLNQQQAMLSKIALNGSNTILGNVVQAAALKAAFSVNQ